MNRSISVPDDLDARVEAARGDVPRSVFWVRAMEGALGDAPRATESRERPAPPRSPEPGKSARISDADAALSRSARTPSPLAARQQALNKSKGM